MERYVYAFNEGHLCEEDHKDLVGELGLKGANLATMVKLGLPVPFGFTIGTSACRKYFEDDRHISKALEEQVEEKLRELEKVVEKRYAGSVDPLLLSVRSGAPMSMPGMMDSVINLGLNDDTVRGLAKATGDERFAWDAYRVFLEIFGEVVLHVPREAFTELREEAKRGAGLGEEDPIDTNTLKILVRAYRTEIEEITGSPFVEDPMEQLRLTIAAVFDSWNNDNAKLYRRIHNITGNPGTAVNVQRMAFGNLGEDSCSGVAFSRNPMTGEKHLFGEYLPMAQGEAVVAGKRTPKDIRSMREDFPVAAGKLRKIAILLEQHYGDIQDIEFTVEKGELYILQTRNAKRTAMAAVATAVEMEQADLIGRKEALSRVDPAQLVQLLHPYFENDALAGHVPLAKGLAASPGAAAGGVYFHPADVERVTEKGGKAILVRQTTTMEDLGSMISAEGILTKQGGVTCHAAVVARDMGKSCVCGCQDMQIDEQEKTVTIGGKVFHEGDAISIDGNSGCVYEGLIESTRPRIEGDFLTLMKWADSARTIGIRANAGTPREAKQAIAFGAEGIGLCRTERMFLSGKNMHDMRQVLLADTEEERRAKLAEILPAHRKDLYEILSIMGTRPVTVRLLDPPLFELAPRDERETAILSEVYQIPYDELARKVRYMKETNPMLGSRGARLLLQYPEICEMQVRAIIEASLAVESEQEITLEPEIMIPMVVTVRELEQVKRIIEDTVRDIENAQNRKIPYRLNLLVETPRAALVTGDMAPLVDVISYGTNDLTQLVMGLSREDSVQIIDMYRNADIFAHDPFKTIDREGVGQLLEFSVREARKAKPNIRIAICGNQGEDPDSVAYFSELGMDYISLAPFGLPLARLAAAQAAIVIEEKV